MKKQAIKYGLKVGKLYVDEFLEEYPNNISHGFSWENFLNHVYRLIKIHYSNDISNNEKLKHLAGESAKKITQHILKEKNLWNKP